MITRSGRHAGQDPHELQGFIDLLHAERVRSYLEIGARYGDTFYSVMQSLPKGSRGVCVDLPGGNWGTSKSQPYLQAAIGELRGDYDVHCILANSQEPGTAEIVAPFGPFDAVLIDGDHLYDGVKRDWLLYREHARIVAFHDIAGIDHRQRTTGLPVEVPRLWQEIRNDFRHAEFISPGSKMGIGVLWVR